MQLPIQAQPVLRNVSTEKISVVSGITPSVDFPAVPIWNNNGETTMKLPIQAQPINRKVGSLEIAAGTNDLRSVRASPMTPPNVPCGLCQDTCLLRFWTDPVSYSLCMRDCYEYNC